MHRPLRRRNGIGANPLSANGIPVPAIPVVLSELEIAALKERDTYAAVRAGMPPAGATATICVLPVDWKQCAAIRDIARVLCFSGPPSEGNFWT